MALRRKKKNGDGSPGRVKQLIEAYRFTRKQDRWIGWVLLGSILGTFVVFLGVGFLLDQPVLLGLLGFTSGVLVALIVFGRRAERAAYLQIEGQAGAAAAPLNLLKRGWTVTPAVAVTRNQDIVHRVVGRPGAVLVGEGAPSRVGNLLAQEKRKVARVAPEVPVHELVAGDGEGQVPLRKLSRAVTKLPKALTPAQVSELNLRLKALASQQGQLPIPKGPLPKGAKLPRAPR
jgi:Domain of unknown function (DUF4191)